MTPQQSTGPYPKVNRNESSIQEKVKGWRPSPITKSTADPKPNVPECRVCDGGAHAAQHWTVDPRETLFSDTLIITKSKHITKSKKVEYPSNLTMKVVLINIGTSAMGRPTDYRLWVVSGREEASCPLIGHEHPFSIILNSLRETDCQVSAVTNNILTVDGSLYLEHLLKDASGPNFILRLKADVGGLGRAVESYQLVDSSDYWD
ncbi:uncharacterized protein LOC116374372 [Oncorhynchus kisutch]|uniref:uncharacterized protein LOC116374372 n=1 Tax=Oncorhynchus kisutch TaxID=8019 RepID=UPI0012DE98AC|nr:uncharacterized protein LOC116374372 [Oncorhynchus kisutch]